MTTLVYKNPPPIALIPESPIGIALSKFGGKIVWLFEQGSIFSAYSAHFDIQIASDLGFTSIVEEAFSRANASRFEYENPSGTWNPFPSAGLDISLIGHQVRYSPVFNYADAGYYWRVRIDQRII